MEVQVFCRVTRPYSLFSIRNNFEVQMPTASLRHHMTLGYDIPHLAKTSICNVSPMHADTRGRESDDHLASPILHFDGDCEGRTSEA